MNLYLDFLQHPNYNYIILFFFDNLYRDEVVPTWHKKRISALY